MVVTRSKTRQTMGVSARAQKMSSRDWDESLSEDEGSLRSKVTSMFKLLIILACYTATFFVFVNFGFWLSSFGPMNKASSHSVFAAVKEFWGDLGSFDVSQFLRDPVVVSLGIDIGLLILFGAQHTLMSSRWLDKVKSFRSIEDRHKLYRALYVLATGAALYALMTYWRSIPLHFWSCESCLEPPWVLSGLKGLHVLAWSCLYGTSLMLDLPDMIGLNRVIITTPNVTQKSPSLQLMYRVQRHMGLLPLLTILVIYPVMSLDRGIMTMATMAYLYVSWRCEDSYSYARNMKNLRRKRI